MDVLILSTAAPGAADADDPALDEEHWSYMDRFADRMVARGPTLAADRATWTGSVHILDLPSAEAAHRFVEQEPYNRAGAYEQHMIRRFDNRLGRTMWEFSGTFDEPRFMVVAATTDPGLAAQTAPARERLIVHGGLSTLEAARPAGVVVALHAPGRDAVRALLGLGPEVELRIYDWEFGGRR